MHISRAAIAHVLHAVLDQKEGTDDVTLSSADWMPAVPHAAWSKRALPLLHWQDVVLSHELEERPTTTVVA